MFLFKLLFYFRLSKQFILPIIYCPSILLHWVLSFPKSKPRTIWGYHLFLLLFYDLKLVVLSYLMLVLWNFREFFPIFMMKDLMLSFLRLIDRNSLNLWRTPFLQKANLAFLSFNLINHLLIFNILSWSIIFLIFTLFLLIFDFHLTHKLIPKLFKFLDMNFNLLCRNILLAILIFAQNYLGMFLFRIVTSKCFFVNLFEYLSYKRSLSVYLFSGQAFCQLLEFFPKGIVSTQPFRTFPSAIFVTIVMDTSKFNQFFASVCGV